MLDDGPLLTVRSERRGCCGVLSLEGELDLSTIPEFDRHLRSLTWRDPPAHLLVDVSGLRFVDSTGMAGLLGAYESLEGKMGLVGGSYSIDSRLALVGFWVDFLRFPDLDSAMDYFHSEAGIEASERFTG